jgi:hypothetical protein
MADRPPLSYGAIVHCKPGRENRVETARFDHLTRTVSILLSRRTLAGALGLGAFALPNLVDAMKKRKRKKKKITRNAFGCVKVGNFCKNGGQCCSGICQGKKGKKKCQAHDASTCQGQDACVGEVAVCTTTTGVVGSCAVTTGNASYCGRSATCFDCAKDADCVPVCGAGAACIVCAECVAMGLQTACAGLNGGACLIV